MKRLVPLLLLAGLAIVPALAQQDDGRPGIEISYGADPRQRIDFYAVAGQPKAPLLVFVHGGGWRRGDKVMAAPKAGYAEGLGYALASINYRMVPDAAPDVQAADVAQAIAALRARAGELGFDPDRIILSGHSAGAHLTALVSTDTRYLEKAGVPLGAIRGAILLDGAAYDVPRQMANAGPLLGRLYRNAFGEDAAFQRSVSPTLFAGAPDVKRFLIVHDADRADAGDQARRLADALRAAGIAVEVAPIPATNHMQINRSLGDPDFAVTKAVTAFLTASR